MEKPILFMLNLWMENGQGPFYCPDCGVLEGFFAYSPEVKSKVDIINIDFQRPRAKVIEYLGQENQECPVLIPDTTENLPKGAKQSITTGRMFIDDAKLICEYLGEMFNAVKPHP